MKVQVLIIHFTVLKSVLALNFNNNACTSVGAYHLAPFSTKCSHNPDVLSNFESIVDRHGYNLKVYSVTTNDGYILNLYRVSSPNILINKYPIFILHGIVLDSESWISSGNKSLGFNLVEQGYNVWVGTIRGTINSPNHITLSMKNPSFWNYNLDTLVDEDVNVQLKFIWETTQKQILVIGHSMGTTLSFMYISSHTEEAQKFVKGFVALAPVVYLNGILVMEIIKQIGLILIDVLNIFNIKGVLYQEDFFHHLLVDLCKILPELCYSLLSIVPGISVQFPPEELLVFFSYFVSGTSIFQFQQYLQITASKRFQKFDYGESQNLQKYGSITPPVYDLSNISVPVCMFYGKHDFFYTKKNIARIIEELGSSLKYQTSVPKDQEPIYDYSHLDFLHSKNIVKFLYQDLFVTITSNFG